MKILVAEDNTFNVRLVERVCNLLGHQVATVEDGQQAWDYLQQQTVDALITDWMMPRMDGIELIRRARRELKPAPFIMMITALDSSAARTHALDAGADEYITKPIDLNDLRGRLENGLARFHQAAPVQPALPAFRATAAGSMVGVCIAASTGGPTAVAEVLHSLTPKAHAVYLLVQHGPAWMLETFATHLQRDALMPTHLATEGMRLMPGTLIVAPGDVHMVVDAATMTVRLLTTPPENYVRPAADPLFRSAAEAFGRATVAVVLTGMGRDGALGAAVVNSAGGTVIAQDPATAVVGAMPQSVIDLGVTRSIVPLPQIGAAINQTVDSIVPLLQRSR